MKSLATALPPKLFIGLDIHKRSWLCHFLSDLHLDLTENLPPDAEGLRRFVNKHCKTYQVNVVYEAGCCGYEAYRSFVMFGWDTVVVNPADIPRPAKQQFQKNDKVDCLNLARQFRDGHSHRIEIPDIDRQHFRALFRRRNALVKQRRLIKTQIKMALLFAGVKIRVFYDKGTWSKAFGQWLSKLEWPNLCGSELIVSTLRQYRFVEEELQRVSNYLSSYTRIHHARDYRLIRSVPGIGPITACGLLSELGDLRRFDNVKQLASYIGLIPGMHQSGDKAKSLVMTPRAHRLIRSLLVECSWVTIRKDPVLESYYRKHVGKEPKKAIVKVARKLLCRIHAAIQHEIEYELGLVA